MPAANFEASILSNANVNDHIWHMTVQWDAATPAPKAGQFYMLRAWPQTEPPLLSRPISVHAFDAQSGVLEFLYEVRGTGTQKLAALQAGGSLALTGPVGNGFPVNALRGKVALVGGGIGTAPLLQLAKELYAAGVQVDYYAGFRTLPVCIEAFEPYCARMELATESGAAGYRGYVTDLLDVTMYDAICTCGPEIMMEKVARMAMEQHVRVYVSKEAKMACGVGACLGCTCMGAGAAAGTGLSVCKDGPVFEGGLVYG